ETTSVLLGYDNFWQISANADYFARRAESPFTHLWYMAILLQFEAVFPLLFVLTKKLFGRRRPGGPAAVFTLLLALSVGAFFIMSERCDMVTVYYSTFSRVFSLLLGVCACLWIRIPRRRKLGMSLSKIPAAVWFSLLTGGMIYMFFAADSASPYFAPVMFGASVLNVLIIYISVAAKDEGPLIGEKLFSAVSSVSYELYLIQYLFVYLAGFVDPSAYPAYLITSAAALASLLSAAILHFAFSSIGSFGKKKAAAVCLCLVAAFSLFGAYRYVIAEDHTEEMEALRQQIAENEALMQQKQDEYALRMQQEADAWEKMLLQMENDEQSLDEMVRNMPVTVIADSVMLGASDVFTETFTNVYMDAIIGRLIMSATEKAEELEESGMLAPCVILHLGTNGDGPDEYKEELQSHLMGCEAVFWIGCSNDWGVHVNDEYRALAEKYDNTHYIDWEGVSAGHSEYFYDGLHLSEEGKHVYTDLIYRSVLEVYREIFEAKKAQIIAEHEKAENEKVSFYGNDLVLGICSVMGGRLSGSGYFADSGWDAEDVAEKLAEAQQDGTLTRRVVLGFDSSLFVTEEDYASVASLLEGREVFVLAVNERTVSMDLSGYGITVIDLTELLKARPEYMSPDGIHLSEEGSAAAAREAERVLFGE
ncbi:MAG: acyltransferase, partial [Eubacteriaceae bacterium]|nr:acyltransferase [Eubacteriaceae bacterium]